MNAQSKIILALILVITLFTILYRIQFYTKNNSRSSSSLTVEVPAPYSATKMSYPAQELRWLPNGYCGTPENHVSCDIFEIQHTNSPDGPKLFISSPAQFGFLNSDTQECFNEVKKNIQIGSNLIAIKEMYVDLSQIHYRPENIDKGKSPYDCADVSTDEANFHHLEGCGNNVCVWADKSFGLDEFYSVTSRIKIQKI